MSCFFIFILIITRFDSFQSATRQLSLQTGASVTIPCHYDKEYIQHKKYWCYEAHSAFNYCKIQAYANNTQGRVTVTDNPAESLFTVTMNNLQTENTGYYWCVVEIGGIMEPDVKEHLHITVKAVPDLSVKESRVRGEEGGSVTVQCLYSAAYQNEQKQWCRFKDMNCNTFQRSKMSYNSAVQLSDGGRGSFSVEISRLKKSDAGWYWCSAGDLQVPVHISVSDKPPGIITHTHPWLTIVTATMATTVTTTETTTLSTYTSVLKHNSAARLTAASSREETISVSKHNSAARLTAVSSSDKTTSVSKHVSASVTNEPSSGKTIWSEFLIYLMALLLLLVILVIIFICILKKKHKAKNQIRTRVRSNDTTVHTPTLPAEDSIIYSTVSKLKSSKSKVNEEDVTYSSIKCASKKKSVSPNDVDDQTIYSSVVCKRD